MTYTLYYYPDNASLIVRLTLEELCCDFKTILVDRKLNAQCNQSYLEINPNGKIPALDTPDGIIYETAAILLYLADYHQKLSPSINAPERAEFLKWLLWISNTLHPALQVLFYPNTFVGSDPHECEKLQDIQIKKITHLLDILNTELAKKPLWSDASGISITHFYICAILRWLQLYPKNKRGWFTLRNWSTLFEIAHRIENRASVLNAIIAEGLNGTPFSAAKYVTPKEGSVT